MTISVSLRTSGGFAWAPAPRPVELGRAPTLPREFYARSTARALGFIAWAISLWLVPGTLATWLAPNAPIAWLVLVPVPAGLRLVAGHGLHHRSFAAHHYGALDVSRRGSQT